MHYKTFSFERELMLSQFFAPSVNCCPSSVCQSIHVISTIPIEKLSVFQMLILRLFATWASWLPLLFS